MKENPFELSYQNSHSIIITTLSYTSPRYPYVHTYFVTSSLPSQLFPVTYTALCNPSRLHKFCRANITVVHTQSRVQHPEQAGTFPSRASAVTVFVQNKGK